MQITLPPRFTVVFAHNLRSISDAVADAVRTSFTASAAPMSGAVPASEVKRRTEMAADIAMTLSADLGWSVPRIRDHLATYLRFSILGIAYQPASTKHGWFSAAG